MMKFVFALVLCIALSATADPSIISDVRVQNVGTTPWPGRGYTFSTNTFSSICLTDMEFTTPSYNFEYSWGQWDSSYSSSRSLNVSSNVQAEFKWFAKIKASVDVSVSSSTKTSSTSQYVYAVFTVLSYYASVNEAGSDLAEAAKTLLQNEDTPAFFQACGSNYVRGVVRKSKFVSIFSYRTATTERDFNFEYDLNLKISSFGGGASVGVQNSVDYSFSSKATTSQLRIFSRGWGLGHDPEAQLIAYDLVTYKRALEGAFKACQNPHVGLVYSIEVIPWADHLGFQANLPLDQFTAPVDANGTAIGPADIPLYMKKQLLQFNAEFLGEINGILRKNMDRYMQARMCQEFIESNFDDPTNPPQSDLVLLNHVTNMLDGSLGATYAQVLPANVDALFDDAILYMEKASPCMVNITSGYNMWSRSIVDVCSADWADLMNPIVVANKNLDEYCMPSFERFTVEGYGGTV